MAEFKKSIELGGRELVFSTGLVAKQANGSVILQYGDTLVLCALVHKELSESMKGNDFVALTVDYRERSYAAGKIPGGFFKREGKAKDSEVLASRIIDRPLRPLFPSNIGRELSLNVLVLAYDKKNDADILGVIGSSLAVSLSGVPFNGPVGCVRIGYLENEFVVNPTFSQREKSNLDLVVVGTEDKITMIESNSQEISESILEQAFKIAHDEIKKIVAFQKDFIAQMNVEKLPVLGEVSNIASRVDEIYKSKEKELKSILTIFEKLKKEEALSKFKQDLKDSIVLLQEENESVIDSIFENIVERAFRELILEGKRGDGRALDEIRKITCDVGVLPKVVHGSSLFTRGETQSLGTATLGNVKDAQILDELSGDLKKRFMLHYNFPSFSVGDVRPSRGPGRREIGHGNLAEKALEKVLPSQEDFPYTIRVVSDILESNGSSSMASVCAGCLALMDAGVPIKAPVAGISIGLVEEKNADILLVDIAGLEDHYGDMDFKVAGTKEGVTAIQMDIKINGIKLELIPKILELARVSRLKILEIMKSVIAEPNKEISDFAPRLVKIMIPKDKIKHLIGPGGQNIKAIIERTGAELEVKDTGEVYVSAVNVQSFEQAKEIVEGYSKEVELNKVYKAKITKIMAFGAFAEILPGKEGLIHISQLEDRRVAKVEDVVNEGEIVDVKVIGIDSDGKISLTKKDVFK